MAFIPRVSSVVRFGLAVTFALAAALPRPAAAETGAPVLSRVRAGNPAIVALMEQASHRSATFSNLVEIINTTNGKVYVEEGTCGHGVRACLVLKVTVAGSHRFLRILVDTQKSDWDLMGSIGHELRHAVEVLSEPGLSDGAIRFFYKRTSSSTRDAFAFETAAAIDTGEAVRAEVRRQGRQNH